MVRVEDLHGLELETPMHMQLSHNGIGPGNPTTIKSPVCY
jgi:hypothetical protein